MAWHAIRPHDTVQVRDGRLFNASLNSQGRTVLPTPNTVGGAMGSAAPGGRFGWLRGPLLGQDVGASWTPFFSLPRDIGSASNGNSQRAHVVTRVASGSVVLGTHDLVFDGPGGEYSESYIRPDDLASYLSDPTGEVPPSACISTTEILETERRVGLARDDFVAREGYFYQTAHLRLRDEFAFLAECDIEIDAGNVPLGGAMRRAAIEPVAVDPWPAIPRDFPDGRLLVYVATPAIWQDGAVPPPIPAAALIACSIGSPIPAALGASRVNGTTKTQFKWMVPAGSVYYFQFETNAAASLWASSHHATAWGRPGSAPEQDNFTSTGFGVILTGRWE